MEIGQAALLFAAGFGGGIAAAIAGGASLITFPTLLAMGLPPVAANATNAVACRSATSLPPWPIGGGGRAGAAA